MTKFIGICPCCGSSISIEGNTAKCDHCNLYMDADHHEDLVAATRPLVEPYRLTRLKRCNRKIQDIQRSLAENGYRGDPIQGRVAPRLSAHDEAYEASTELGPYGQAQ